MQVIDPAKEFARSLAKVLVHEGGYSNHPQDPGGATMKGVTQRVYDEYRRSIGVPVAPVRNISNSELEAIYRKDTGTRSKATSSPRASPMSSLMARSIRVSPSRLSGYSVRFRRWGSTRVVSMAS
jgi:hypothetical protein